MNLCFVGVENDRNLYSLVNCSPAIFLRCRVSSVLIMMHDLKGYIQFTLNTIIYPVMHYRNDLSIFNVNLKRDMQLSDFGMLSARRAKVSNNKNNEEKNYIGLTERSFQDRLYKHKNSLRYRTKANATELSKYFWGLRDRNIEDVNIEWSILDKASTHRNGSKTCRLCLTGKFYIIFHNKENLLNERSEIFSTCRHRNKFLLSNFKEMPPDD